MFKERFTNRRLQLLKVRNKTEGSITTEGGIGFVAPKEVIKNLEIGEEFYLETQGYNLLSGFLVRGTWYAHKSDQTLAAEQLKHITDAQERQNERVELNREAWTKRENALPEWAQNVMNLSRDDATAEGKDFDTMPMGWGYHLVAIEYATLLVDDAANNVLANRSYTSEGLPQHILDFERENGMSGNQVGWAWVTAYYQIKKEEKK